MEVSYDIIRKKFPDVFCVDNLRRVFKQNNDELSMSFTDFLLYAEDYYLLKYAGKMSKTAWWLFSLLRHLVRRDGFVKLSYFDIIGYFRIEGKEAISKPTFFKYVDELESLGVVKRYNNKRLFNTQYQNDSNTYVVIGCIDEFLSICKRVSDDVSFSSSVLNLDKPEPKPKKKKRKEVEKTDTEWYKEISEYYSDVWPVFDEFFNFLGKKNTSGRISLSRKVKIAKYAYERDDCPENIEYAIRQTMKRNVLNEKYMFAILRGFEDGEVAPPVTPDGKVKYEQKPSGMSKEEYEQHKHELIVGENKFYYQDLLRLLSRLDTLNEYEQRLYNVACAISDKMEFHDRKKSLATKRSDMLCSKYNIYERYTYDRRFNKVIIWIYDDDDDRPVPKSVMRDIKRKHKDMFVFYKYLIPDRRLYSGL